MSETVEDGLDEALRGDEGDDGESVVSYASAPVVTILTRQERSQRDRTLAAAWRHKGWHDQFREQS